MDNAPILKDPWPADLDPATVSFKQRTVTVLRRRGLLDDWSKFNRLAESDVLSWWNTGAITLEDLRLTGNEAIRRHHDEEGLRRDLDAYMDEVATKPWVRHVWYHDPRFSDFLPKGDATVYDIATSGSALDQRYLWGRHDALQAALDTQAALSLVEAVSGQHGQRLTALLARTGLGGEDPITGIEAGWMLGVTQQRTSQIVRQLRRRRDLARPPGGEWMPQLDEAEREDWPEQVSSNAREAIREFLDADRSGSVTSQSDEKPKQDKEKSDAKNSDKKPKAHDKHDSAPSPQIAS